MLVKVNEDDIIEAVYHNIDLMEIFNFFIANKKGSEIIECINKSDLDTDLILSQIDNDELKDYMERLV